MKQQEFIERVMTLPIPPRPDGWRDEGMKMLTENGWEYASSMMIREMLEDGTVPYRPDVPKPESEWFNWWKWMMNDIP